MCNIKYKWVLSWTFESGKHYAVITFCQAAGYTETYAVFGQYQIILLGDELYWISAPQIQNPAIFQKSGQVLLRWNF